MTQSRNRPNQDQSAGFIPLNRSKRWGAFLLLSLIGFFISIYQTYRYFVVRSGEKGFESFCAFHQKFNCDAVESSAYAEILPGIPLSALAAGWFLSMSILAIKGRDRAWSLEARRIALALTSIATAFSVAYFMIMAGVLKTFCILCLVIDGINVANLALVISLKPFSASQGPFQGHLWRRFSAVWLGCLTVGIIASLAFQPKSISAQDQKVLVSRVMNRAPVSVEINESMPRIGNPDAEVTIVKFSDFHCPHCQKGAYSLHPLLNKYRDKVEFVFMNFPLDGRCNHAMERPGQGVSCEAAKATLCAADEGEFEKTYQKLFDRQQELSQKTVEAVVQETMGWESEQLADCLNDSQTKETLNRSVDEAIRLGVNSTPTFFINGRRVDGAYPTEAWEKLIQQMLDDTSSNSAKSSPEE